jgi:uracil-DNA glycosylase
MFNSPLYKKELLPEGGHMNFLDTIIQNARSGIGPCSDCPAYEETKGRYVNPGFSNFTGKIIFVTNEPSHFAPGDPNHIFSWENYASWAEYNKVIKRKFFHEWPGGRWLQKHFLYPLSLSASDLWIADSLKCQIKKMKNKAFKHCSNYLKEEIKIINPAAVVTLGAPATRRTLEALEVPADIINNIKITEDFGLFNAKTKWPVIISLHWAQQSLKTSDFIPVVQKALSRF